MATYSNLGITLITTGDESGTWGTTTNSNFESILDEAIAGAVTYNISSDADFTLTVVDATSSDARHAVIKFTSTTLSATRTCTFAPDTLQKTWVVINATTGGQSLTFKQGSAGATVTVPNGESAIIYSDGGGASAGAITRVLDSFTNTKITTGTLNATTLDLTNLEVTNIKAKDGTAAATIADSTGVISLSANPTLSGGTANGVLYLNGSKVATSGSALVFDGTNAAIGTTTNKVTGVSGSGTGLTVAGGVPTVAVWDVANASYYFNLSQVGVNSYLWNIANGANIFGVNNAEQMRLNTTGLGIGTSSPAAKLNVAQAMTNGSTGAFTNPHLALTATTATDNTGFVGMTMATSDSTEYGYSYGALRDAGGIGDLIWKWHYASAAGTELLRLTYSGNLGIGTSSPSSATWGKFVAVEATYPGIVFNSTAGGGKKWSIGADAAVLTFRNETDSTTAAVIDGSNNVGIGTASPATRLHVQLEAATETDIARFRVTNGANNHFLDIGADEPNKLVIFDSTGSAAGGYVFRAGGTERMRLDSSGNLCVGSTSPGNAGVINLSVGNPGTTAGGLQLWSTTGSTHYVQFGDSASGGDPYRGAVGYAHASDAMLFLTAGSERMRLDSSGNLGIGTSSPASKLDVNGAISASGTIFRPDSGFIQWNSTGASGGTNRAIIWADSSSNLYFGTGAGNSTQATLDSSGNLGLGVTPSAWNSTYRAAQIGVSASYIGRSSGTLNQAGFYANAYVDSGGVERYVNTDEAGSFQYFDGKFAWFNAASGTAGNAISFTQAMTLDASGQLALGRTSATEIGANIRTVDMDGTSGAGFRLRANGTNIANIYAVSSAVYMAAPANVPIVFETNNTERARITAGGYSKFSSNGTYLSSTGTYHEFYQSANAEGLRVYTSDSSTYNSDAFKVDAERATTNSTYNLANFRNGNGTGQCIIRDSGNIVNTNNSYGQISDIKTKQDVVDAASQWDDIKGVRVRKFRFKSDPAGPLQIGVIAQELEQVSPGLVNEAPDYEEVDVTDAEGNVTTERQPAGTTTKSVKYSVLYMKAIKALQEAMARIEQLEAKVAALEAK